MPELHTDYQRILLSKVEVKYGFLAHYYIGVVNGLLKIRVSQSLFFVKPKYLYCS